MVNYLQFTVHPPPLPQPFGDPLSLPLPASDVTAHGCSFVIECLVCPYKGLSSLGKCQTLIQVWPGYVRRSQKTSGSGCTFRTLNLGQRAKFRIVYKLTSIAGPLCTWKVWCLSVSHIVKIVVEKARRMRSDLVYSWCTLEDLERKKYRIVCLCVLPKVLPKLASNYSTETTLDCMTAIFLKSPYLGYRNDVS